MSRSGDRHLRSDPGDRLGQLVPGDRSVLVMAEVSYAGTLAGQILLSLLIDLLARQFGVVSRLAIDVPSCPVNPTAFPRSSSATATGLDVSLYALARSVGGGEIEVVAPRSLGTPAVVVWVGSGEAPVRGQLMTISSIGNGWNAWASTVAPSPVVRADSLVPFGPHIAACLASDRVFRCFRSVDVDGTTNLNIFRFGPARWDDQGPDVAGIVLPAAYLVGLGAVGAAFAYSLACVRASQGDLIGIDPQTSDETSRNRLLSADHDQSDVDKAELVADLFRGSEIDFHSNVIRWPDYASDPDHHAPSRLLAEEARFRFDWVVSCVDRNESRRSIANYLPRHVLSGSTDGLVAQVTYYSVVGACECLACNHPVPTYDVEGLRAELEDLTAEQRWDRLQAMGASLEEWAGIEDYLRDPDCGHLGEAALRRLGIEGATDWAVGFVSAAAGVMLAAAFVAIAIEGVDRAIGEGPERRLIFWRSPEEVVSRARRKPDCPVCSDADARSRFERRWS